MVWPFSSSTQKDPTKKVTLLECVDVYVALERFFIVVWALAEGVAFVLGLISSGLVMCFELLCTFVVGVVFLVNIVLAAVAAVFVSFT
jgi:hypothetical protein